MRRGVGCVVLARARGDIGGGGKSEVKVKQAGQCKGRNCRRQWAAIYVDSGPDGAAVVVKGSAEVKERRRSLTEGGRRIVGEEDERDAATTTTNKKRRKQTEVMGCLQRRAFKPPSLAAAEAPHRHTTPLSMDHSSVLERWTAADLIVGE